MLIGSLKTCVARSLCNPLIGRLIRTILRERVPCRGCVIDTNNPYVTDETVAKLALGFYESAEIRFVKRYLSPGMDVVELGSSLGVVSAHIACKMNRRRRLICVEANPYLLGPIRTNLAINAPDLHVVTFNRAIDYSGVPEVALQIGRTNLSSFIVRTPANISKDSIVNVPTVQLRDIVQQQGFSEFALVCDIEGGEIGLLLEDESIMRAQQLIIELHTTEYKGETWDIVAIQEQIRRLGFRLHDQHGPVCYYER